MVANRKNSKLTKKKKAYLRGKLIERRTELLGLLQRRVDQASRLAPQVVGDEFDAASDRGEFDTDLGVATLESANLADVEHALRKLEEGTYGRCEACGCDIPEPRLRAMPFAALCVSCKEQEELVEGSAYAQGEGTWNRVSEGSSLESLEKAAHEMLRAD